jgi:TolB-like protein/Flp pilus assembly protein TadD
MVTRTPSMLSGGVRYTRPTQGESRVTDGPTDGEDASFWQRLRRRKVVQWGIAYAAGAWGLLQGLSYVVATFHWPERLQQLATIALLVGLPVALTLAWYHGDKGQQRVSRAELAVLTLLLLLGGGLFWYYERSIPSADSAAATQALAQPATAAIPTDRSIAVLPFVNMSPDKEQEYFADGISEELLNLLAQVPQLRVIARTSSFSFKGKEADVATIAKALNVANVLEGSVRKSGDTVRITAQLIRASDSSHLWSQTYDRQMTDVLTVQDEIAAAVVAQLKIELLGGAPKVRETDPRAFALYLQARELGRQRTKDGFERSIALYQQALAIDPNYVAAWVGLGTDYLTQTNKGLRPIDEGFRLAREAATKALTIDPSYALAYSTLGRIATDHDGDLAAAASYVERALALDPTNPAVIRSAADLAQSLGRMQEALALDAYVVARDPVNASGYGSLAFEYGRTGHLDEAIAGYRTALSLSPGRIGTHYNIAELYLRKGEPQAALEAIQQEPDEGWRRVGLPMVYHSLGRRSESDAALADLINNQGNEWAYNIAYVLAWCGHSDRAFEWLDKAATLRDPGLVEIINEPMFANIQHDPRLLPFLRKIGRAPEQLAAINFDVKLPN